GGLWHGASWNFVIWGAIHGFMLALERYQGKDSAYRRLPRPLRVGITFAVVCVAWVFFRAKTLPQAWAYLACLFGLGPVTEGSGAVSACMYAPYHVLVFLLAALLVWRTANSWAATRRITPARAGFVGALFVLSVLFMWTQTENPFIY